MKCSQLFQYLNLTIVVNAKPVFHLWHVLNMNTE